MTAANHMTFGTGVVLFSDAAQYISKGGDVVISGFASKLRIYEAVRFGFVATGRRVISDTVQHLAEQWAREQGCDLDFDLAVDLLPRAGRHVARQLAEDGQRIEFGGLGGSFHLAGWSAKAGDWAARVMATYDDPSTSKYAAFEMHDMETAFHPKLEIRGAIRQLTPDELVGNLGALGSRDFARSVLQHQRRQCLGLNAEGVRGECIVGGWGEIAIIKADAVKIEKIMEWPDAVGETQADLLKRVKAEPVGRLMVDGGASARPAPPSRADRRRASALARRAA